MINSIKRASQHEFILYYDIVGRISQCFLTKYGKLLEFEKAYGQGIQGFTDYRAELEESEEMLFMDDDEYTAKDLGADAGAWEAERQAPMDDSVPGGKRKPAIAEPKPKRIVKTKKLEDAASRDGPKSNWPERLKRWLGLSREPDARRSIESLQKRQVPIDPAPPGQTFGTTVSALSETSHTSKKTSSTSAVAIPIPTATVDLDSLRVSNKFTEDTVMLSQAPPGDQYSKNYLFDATDGEGAVVYIMDSGFDPKHNAFTWKVKDKSVGWIFGAPNQAKEQKDYRPRKAAYVGGTEVAAKVIGQTTGLARKASTYMVIPYDADGKMTSMLYLDALVKMYKHIMTGASLSQTPGGRQKGRKSVICFSHRTPTAVRLNEMWRWPKLKKVPKSKTDYIDAVTSVMDEILIELGKNPNVVMVTRVSGILIGPAPMRVDPIMAWPARRAPNITNLVLVGGVDHNGRRIMHVPPSAYRRTRPLFAPAANIRVPYSGRGNVENYYTAKHSIRLAVSAVSGILAGYMGKYGDNGTTAASRLQANAYPRVFGGSPVVWNGLRIAYCDRPIATVPLYPSSTRSLPKPKPTSAASKKLSRREEKDKKKGDGPSDKYSYISGEKVSCQPIPLVAQIIPGAKDKKGKSAKPSVRYLWSSVHYTKAIPPPPSPTLPRQTFSFVATITETMGASQQGPRAGPKPMIGFLPYAPTFRSMINGTPVRLTTITKYITTESGSTFLVDEPPVSMTVTDSRSRGSALPATTPAAHTPTAVIGTKGLEILPRPRSSTSLAKTLETLASKNSTVSTHSRPTTPGTWLTRSELDKNRPSNGNLPISSNVAANQ
ncbi:hypothetical protein DRE_03179 [Drechslerella stenobrocha 248]|uniref:Peptidase S8/S53 domain-containing protein n=1 Tax=Drechslerella stenobrocha 248 TaxID=1043628 RepID=W7HVM0_9PEZI|nr:hypothetical protein DRE_03179 [Drechslerella stenobrocha 248]